MKIENLKINKDHNNWIIEEEVPTENPKTGEKTTRVEKYYYSKVEHVLSKILNICLKNNMEGTEKNIKDTLENFNNTMNKLKNKIL